MSSYNLVYNLPQVFLLRTKISECKFLFIAINVNVGAGRPPSEILSSLRQIFGILVVSASMCLRYEEGSAREIWNKINQRKFLIRVHFPGMDGSIACKFLRVLSLPYSSAAFNFKLYYGSTFSLCLL